MTKLKFEELNLSKPLLDAIKDMGFEEASPIQSDAIPIIMEGKDIVGQAQTGTGKTAAFAIPVIEKIDVKDKALQAVVLCPTRELVIQVAEEFNKLLKYKKNIAVVPVYGGQQIDRQLRALEKGAQIVIGTPGRTMDHIRRGSIEMDSVETIVLDEADEMLDMGFREDIDVILTDTPEDRQTILFSATMAKEILDLTKRFQKNPVVINVTHKTQSKPNIQQVYLEVQDRNKPEVLTRLIDLHNIKLAVVFCNTKSQVDLLVEILKTRGYFADGLHGDMGQNFRDKVMNGFRNGTVEILVATDVAGRGIDVNNVEAVFNYDLPRDDEDYIHRIGRTARAGKSGTAFTFVTGKQVYNLKRIERNNGIQIHRQNVPTLDELETNKINSYASKITEIIEEGHLAKFINQVEEVMGEDYTSLDVAAALLKLIIEKENENFDKTADFTVPEYKEEKSFRKKGGFGKGGFARDGGNRGGRDRDRNRGDRKRFDKPFKSKSNDGDGEFKKDFSKSEFKKDDFKKDDFKKRDFKRSDSKKDDFKKDASRDGFKKRSEGKSFSKDEKPFKRESKPFKKSEKSEKSFKEDKRAPKKPFNLYD